MLDLFTDDRRSVTFPEQSSLSSPAEERLRLKPLPDVKRALQRIRAPLLVLKPLVESQNVEALLDRGSTSPLRFGCTARPRALPPRDLAYFGIETGERNLRLLLSNDPPNWRGEFVPESTRSVIERHYRPGMNPYDAAALFWWARTSLYFDLGLDARADVRLCSYERLVAGPEATMRSLYDFVGVPYPDQPITDRIHGESARLRRDCRYQPRGRALCDELLERLDSVATAKTTRQQIR